MASSLFLFCFFFVLDWIAEFTSPLLPPYFPPFPSYISDLGVAVAAVAIKGGGEGDSEEGGMIMIFWWERGGWGICRLERRGGIFVR